MPGAKLRCWWRVSPKKDVRRLEAGPHEQHNPGRRALSWRENDEGCAHGARGCGEVAGERRARADCAPRAPRGAQAGQHGRLLAQRLLLGVVTRA